MNYLGALQYITNSYSRGAKHSKGLYAKTLDALSSPQDNLKMIHVAGTNGKGSTCAMLSNILQQAGYRVGVYTSPHLDKYNERISINGQEISDEDFTEQIKIVKSISEGIMRDECTDDYTLSFFEILTVAAFSFFNEQKVDYAIIEVGIGGRLDVTNIIKNPVLSIITSIGYDHMEYLGDSLGKIASEKAGIIKYHCPSVLCSTNKEVYNVVAKIAEDRESKLYYVDQYQISVIKNTLEETVFHAGCQYFDYDALEMKLLGKFQIQNACLVLLSVEALNDGDISISREAVRSGLLKTIWQGRMEAIKKEPIVILDGAHNMDGAVAFSENMEFYFKDQKIITVIGILSDKEYCKMMPIMTQKSEIIILTQPNTQKAIPPFQLYSCIDKTLSRQVIIEENYEKAIDLALDLADIHDIISIVGSLYLVGDARKYLKKK